MTENSYQNPKLKQLFDSKEGKKLEGLFKLFALENRILTVDKFVDFIDKKLPLIEAAQLIDRVRNVQNLRSSDLFEFAKESGKEKLEAEAERSEIENSKAIPFEMSGTEVNQQDSERNLEKKSQRSTRPYSGKKIKILKSTLPGEPNRRQKTKNKGGGNEDKFRASQIQALQLQAAQNQAAQSAQIQSQKAVRQSRKKKKSFAKTLAKIAGGTAVGGTILPLIGGGSADAATFILDLLIK